MYMFYSVIEVGFCIESVGRLGFISTGIIDMCWMWDFTCASDSFACLHVFNVLLSSSNVEHCCAGVVTTGFTRGHVARCGHVAT